MGRSALLPVLLAVALILPSGAGAVSFSSPASFQVGDSPESVAVADFDGDGRPDLAVANEGTNDVSVLIGDGSGGFGAATAFGVGRLPVAVAAADFNADGRPDLAVANSASHDVSILLGSGDGSFGAATNIPVGDTPFALAAGRIDGDDELDLAVANWRSDNVTILIGNGHGSFSAVASIGGGSRPQALALDRFDGDDKLDLAVANNFADEIAIHRGNGDGSFGAPAAFPVGTRPAALAVGRFDEDADADLAVANLESDDVSILLGNGDGSFGATAQFSVGGGPSALAVGRFDGDDELDLAVADQITHQVSILLGTGDGGFGDRFDFSVGSSPSSLVVSDFNGDSRLDLAVANASSDDVSIMLGQAEPTLSSHATAAVTIGATISASATIAGGDAPTGEIVFRAFAPYDAECTWAPVFEEAVEVDGNGEYETGGFMPFVASVYNWTVSYGGDATNAPAESACGEPGLTSEVAMAMSVTTLASTPNPASEGEPVRLTATVSGFEPSGEVLFTAGGATLGSAALDGSGRAALTTTELAEGAHEIVARYGGDANNEPSASAAVSQRVDERRIDPPPAPLPACPQLAPAPSGFKPAVKRPGRQLPGVRARIRVAAPAQLEVAARLRFKRNGRIRTVSLGTHSLANPGVRNLRLALPRKLRRALPPGTPVRLTLSISASAGCGAPQLSAETIRTRVVRVLPNA